MSDRFSSMTELLRALPAADNYSIQVDTRYQSRVKIFAPHGGCIEPCTGPIVLALADGRFDSFVFHGVRKKDCYRELHVTSTHYDEPACLSMASQADLAIAVHGCDGNDEFMEIGGANTVERESLAAAMNLLGYRLRPPGDQRRGEQPENFANRAKYGGIQIELSAGFRRMLFPGFPRAAVRHPANFPRFINSFRAWLITHEQQLHPPHA
jgi:phage replication-related protein YjqB (UPF0714/DUF867 family)